MVAQPQTDPGKQGTTDVRLPSSLLKFSKDREGFLSLPGESQRPAEPPV